MDVRRIPGEEIAPTLSFSTLENSVVLETKQNLLEELRGDLLRAGQIGDSHRLAPLVSGEAEECFDGVLGFFREHSVDDGNGGLNILSQPGARLTRRRNPEIRSGAP